MKRTSIFLPDDLIKRLEVESARTGAAVSALIRRAIDAVTPPIGLSPGELRKHIDRYGLLKVLILDAREGRLLVEPQDADVQIWLDANLVTFPEAADAISHQLIPPTPKPAAWDGLRLNIAPRDPDEPEEKS